jgi:predicted Zn-dependent peptidase
VTVYFEQSTNVSIFTYLPMGMAEDGAEQTQWSHLVEHLVIRSTISEDLAIANGETLPDHMRLDFYGTVENWKQGIDHCKRWLQGLPFTQKNLATEKPKIDSEVDFTVKNFATHKFAMAAWAQGARHGRSFAAVRGDVARASLPEIQKYRDDHFAVLSNTVICVVGGIRADQVRSISSEERLEQITSRAQLPEVLRLHPGRHDMSWDLDARHIVLAWPLPRNDQATYAATMTVAAWVSMQFYSDATLQKLAGMTLTGADLHTPEGDFFYISASLRPGSTFQEIERQLKSHLSKLLSSSSDLSWIAPAGRQQAEALTTLPDPFAFKNQLPPNVTPEMMEGNLGLQWGMTEFRYGPAKKSLVSELSKLKTEQVQAAAKKYLAEDACIAVNLHPR